MLPHSWIRLQQLCLGSAFAAGKYTKKPRRRRQHRPVLDARFSSCRNGHEFKFRIQATYLQSCEARVLREEREGRRSPGGWRSGHVWSSKRWTRLREKTRKRPQINGVAFWLLLLFYFSPRTRSHDHISREQRPSDMFSTCAAN